MNPVTLSRRVEERYRRYLQTTFYFKDPVLRHSFEAALNTGHLTKGPYLEATPAFKTGLTTAALVTELLGDDVDRGTLAALQGKRPLYRHQELAIRSGFGGRNVVVATGTGSGKTEAFLYPVLLHLYEQYRAGTLGAGVRALILYPMNALANDQRERLATICTRLKDANSPFRLTFGQYIGETPENANDTLRHGREHALQREQSGHSILENGQVVHGELVFRSEMRTTPPHILLTNYSMLEYLLLRPDDSPLFDDGRGSSWTFLVLDEAHQYRGAKGSEMAMLLRRLKQRLREGGRNEPFRCIATSATLAGGERDRAAVAEFAAQLFGEPFNADDVILGEREWIAGSGVARFERSDYGLLARALDRDADALAALRSLAARYHMDLATNEPHRAVRHLLQQDIRATQLRQLITTGPEEVQSVAERLFQDVPEPERVEALSELVALLLRATDPDTEAPLLLVRYHLFLRSLEGAFVSLYPEKKVVLDRRGEGGSALFEIGLCRECGQLYLVGRIENDKLVEAVRDPGREDFGAVFCLPLDGQSVDDEDEADRGEPYVMCARCGEIRRSGHGLRCGHGAQIDILKQQQMDAKGDQARRCVVCGYQGRDPVREVVHGTDGPHAVIATTLFHELPEDRRKVLAFADGRQEAAFFAWYLEKSYREILGRNLIRTALQQQAPTAPEGSSFEDLVSGLRDVFLEKKVLPPAASDLQLRREAWLALYREFLSEEPRTSLEGVGLAQWTLAWPTWVEVPEVLTAEPWSLSHEEAWNLLSVLFDTMRADRAVELRPKDGVSLKWADLLLQATQMRISPTETGKLKRDERKWAGRTGRRVALLAKLYQRIHHGAAEREAIEAAVVVLRAIWEALRQYDNNAPTDNDRLLVRVKDARRLNPDWWRLRYIERDATLRRCDTCGRLQTRSLRDVCARHRCPGTLRPVRRTEMEPNHYALLYEAELPGALRAEEHTAQLEKEKAREFQREFRDGKIHVLSCSTTFELGVDLGDLDTVFLRNVPPEPFNYAQRIGRSGRRSGHPGFAITYCRRGPHDLYHFAEPTRMLAGKSRPPLLPLRNEKIIARHNVAVALSFFFKTAPERFASVGDLFKDLDRPSGVNDLARFLRNRRPDIEATLRAILPAEMANRVGLDDGSWIDKITGRESRFALAEAEVSSDYRLVRDLENSAVATRDYDTAKWARRRCETIAGEDVLSFLSRKAVIPKYGFPVDVVDLDTQRADKSKEASEVSLQRDLSIAISEFAPTSKLVANKKEWTSYGLKKVAEREWDRRRYARCTTHNVFLQWKEAEASPSGMPCGCRIRERRYVIPQFGFVTKRDEPEEPKARPAKVFSTRPYFVQFRGLEPERIRIPAASSLVSVTKASPGLMVVLCEGQKGSGFYLCGVCGAGFPANQAPPHQTPQGRDCRGTLENVSLGHEFVTDVLTLQFQRPLPDGVEPVAFGLSLAYAIVEGAAEVLEVPSADLSATVTHATGGVPPIVLYDDVPGGAGLVARLELEGVLRECLESTLKRVEGGCGCAPNTSCYGCLRHYRNQFAHPRLARGPVYDYVKAVLQQW
jgi:ATP-dependent helicase YprA (DUF1998 family)